MSATQYAHALMQLAQEHNNPTLWLDYLSELAAISQDKYFIEYIYIT
jgi:F0F1-type ATP synthase delta subunit